eukprot:CAMPEP_0194370064 /NCGR_PEP_ID=MMETSP0174-20130528/18405_1 /TAXON_ID=216777 /ORGANISM="Proboscia alata, Strain PI-D3" /LENGTH=363 /DNA_ID=CAMNT_0039147351 /DNA_START=173 /DNA_END=1264 /DNA_ORIENTATION=-
MVSLSAPKSGASALRLHKHQHWGKMSALSHRAWSTPDVLLLRGGVDESEEDDEDSDDEVSEDEYEEETDEGTDEDETEEEYDEEEYEYEEEEEEVTKPSQRSRKAAAVQEYDDCIPIPPMQNMLVSMGTMFLTRKLDPKDRKIVMIARFTFIGYMIIMQAFLTYARIMARMRNNRTPITITNAMADMVKTQLSSAISKQTPGGSKGQGENDMVKGLTSKLLSSESTVMEYDMKQAASARSSLLMPLLFTWVIHFKFGQVQPLFLQASSGIVSLIYSPLFQIYVLGRNLERPFKTGLGAGLKAALGQQEEAKEETDGGKIEEEDDDIEEESDEEGEEDDDDGSDEEEEDSDDGSSDEEEEDSDE